jgi:hypothetical protein
VLRRVLRLAVEWGALESAPKIELLTGERRRERVMTCEEESRYLAAASPLLASVATILADTGSRPDECRRLRWEEITWVNGCNGTLLVTHGKTAAGTASSADDSQSQRSARTSLDDRWNAARGLGLARAHQNRTRRPFKPQQHVKALKLSGVRCFVLSIAFVTPS